MISSFFWPNNGLFCDDLETRNEGTLVDEVTVGVGTGLDEATLIMLMMIMINL